MTSAEIIERYLSKHRNRLKYRAILIDLLTLTDENTTNRVVVDMSADNISDMLKSKVLQFEVIEHKSVRHEKFIPGDVVSVFRRIKEVDHYVGKGYIDEVSTDNEKLIMMLGLFNKGNKAIDIYDKFMLKKGMIPNFEDTPPIETTVGRYITNEIILVEAFGNKIKYINTPWKMGDIEKKIANGLLDKSILKSEYDKFIDGCFYLGHFTELCVPTLTKKSFMTDPKVKKVKEELLKKYKGQLTDPEVIKIIEDTLLAMDKDFLKGDNVTRFYDAIGSKVYNVHRKKLFLSIGGISAFDDAGGKFDFIENSLEEGFTANNFASLANESRKGSYDRGKNTAKGGALTKFIMRVFQDMSITEENCGSKKGITVTITGDNKSSFINRHILEGAKTVVLTDKNIGSYLGKTIKIRSPLYCKTKNGLCYTCVGEIFRSLSTEALGMLVVDISSTFMYLSMRNMHGTKLEFITIDPNAYVVSPFK